MKMQISAQLNIFAISILLKWPSEVSFSSLKACRNKTIATKVLHVFWWEKMPILTEIEICSQNAENMVRIFTRCAAFSKQKTKAINQEKKFFNANFRKQLQLRNFSATIIFCKFHSFTFRMKNCTIRIANFLNHLHQDCQNDKHCKFQYINW